MVDHYTKYYLLQSGGGLSNIGAVYHQSPIIQHGRGLGNFFGGLARYLKPFFMHGLNAVKKEALNTGADILGEIGTRPIQDIIREKTKTAVQNLQDKAINNIRSNMYGAGINSFKKYNCGSLTDVNSHKTKLLKSRKKTKAKKNKITKIKKNTKKKSNKKSVERTLDIFS